MADRYDVVIIGAGQAGVPLASALAKAGRRVALAEQEHLGGSCVNFGCTPTKAAIASARVAHMARRAGDYGITIPDVTVDFARVIERAARIAAQSRTSLDKSFAGRDNPALLRGHAQFTGRDGDGFRLRVGERDVVAAEVVLDTGTRTAMPPIDGLDGVATLTSENWLARRTLPAHLVFIGGGYIGLEMSQFYRRMGSRVTVIQHGDQVAPHEDPDVASALCRVLEDEGIRFVMHAKARRVMREDDCIAVEVETAKGVERIRGSDLFVATGRQPNTDRLGLETIGLECGKHGIIEVDERLRSKVPGIWAAGDIRGGPMFTHTAWDDYRILASQMTGGGERTTKRVVPYAIFTDPELGRVGMTEREARAAGLDVKIGRFEFAHNGKAKELGETTGFVKLVVEATSDKLLGAAVFGHEGAELVHLYIDLMNADAPVSVIEQAIHIHPTLAEALQSAVTSLG